jgi:hypothetical protein
MRLARRCDVRNGAGKKGREEARSEGSRFDFGKDRQNIEDGREGGDEQNEK